MTAPKCDLCGSRDRVTPDGDYTGKNLCYSCWASYHRVFIAGFERGISAMKTAENNAKAEIESQTSEAESEKSIVQRKQDLAAVEQCRGCKHHDGATPDDCAICAQFTADEADAANVGECPRFERRPKA